jgi:hypothetical protein
MRRVDLATEMEAEKNGMRSMEWIDDADACDRVQTRRSRGTIASDSNHAFRFSSRRAEAGAANLARRIVLIRAPDAAAVA